MVIEEFPIVQVWLITRVDTCRWQVISRLHVPYLSALNPVHTSKNVDATFSNATSRTILSTKSNVASILWPFLATMLPFLTTMLNEISSFRLSRNNWTCSIWKDKISRKNLVAAGYKLKCLVQHVCLISQTRIRSSEYLPYVFFQTFLDPDLSKQHSNVTTVSRHMVCIFLIIEHFLYIYLFHIYTSYLIFIIINIFTVQLLLLHL